MVGDDDPWSADRIRVPFVAADQREAIEFERGQRRQYGMSIGSSVLQSSYAQGKAIFRASGTFDQGRHDATGSRVRLLRERADANGPNGVSQVHDGPLRPPAATRQRSGDPGKEIDGGHDLGVVPSG